MLAGVDEAGRGPVLGPLVVAAVLVESEQPLRKLGVKDSKLLTPKKREELEPQIREVARGVETVVITPAELNRRMPRTNLNHIEAAAFATLLKRLQPEEAIVDACDVNAQRFGRQVARRARMPSLVLRAEHEADVRHPVVGAASIVAKVLRDKLMAQIGAEHAEHGACGSGYAHDALTQAFLKSWVERTGELPAFARHEWETSRRLVPAKPPATLESFTKKPRARRAR